MSNFNKAIKIIMAEPPKPRYPSYYADLLRDANVSDTDVGELISRQVAIDAVEESRLFNPHEDSKVARNHEYEHRHFLKILHELPSAQPEIVRCKDCKHRPFTNDNYNADECDCGFDIEFPDYKCPCQCEDAYYNWLPDDNWFCGNAERRTDENE